MAVSRLKTWNTGDILTASDLNGEFNNILNNGTSVAFPLTAAVSFGGFDITHSGNITLDSGKAVIFNGLLKLAQGTVIASAATVDLSTATGNYVQVSGTVTITSFGTVNAGTQMAVEFQGALTLTYNAVSLILPGSANITTAAGDMGVFVSEGGGNWRCIGYFPRTGKGVIPPADADVTFTNITTGNVSATAHGYMPIIPNNATTYLRGDATYQLFSTITGTITLGTVYTLNPYATSTASGAVAHGLGSIPTGYFINLINLSTDANWASNQVVQYASFGVGNIATSVGGDATNFYFATGSQLPEIADRSTGASTTITAAKWKLTVTPFLKN